MKSKTLLSLCFFQTKFNALIPNTTQLVHGVYALFILLITSNTSFGQVTTYENTNPQVTQASSSGIDGSPSQTYSFTTGDNVTQILVECWGGGGGGSQARTNNSAVVGGGGGAYARSTITVTPCTAYTVVVGGGGEGWQLTGTGNNDQPQRPGRPSYFATSGGTVLVLAAGGQSARTQVPSTSFPGGAAADCIIQAGGQAYSGGNGGLATAGVNSGGGGGGAGSDGPGNNATGGTGGPARTFGGGKGANGVTAGGTAGTTGSTWGGGGSGGFKGGGGTPNRNGGFGATGAVRITLLDGSSACPLPIELTTFEGALNERVIDLSWTTASEINNDYFIVKRSYDGTNWNGLAQVNGAGNHQGELNYAMTDVDFDPAYSSVYYALSQVDYDGTISPERKIAVSLAGLWNELAIFPNPVGEMLHVKFKSNEKREQLMLLDMVGKDHLSTSLIEIYSDGSEIVINVSSLTAGIYVIVYGTERLKFVKKDDKD
jgi:hypothetical protein